MATVGIPYSYTYYKDSVLATRVSKFCHAPSRVIWISGISLMLCLYYIWCFSAIPIAGGRTGLLGTLGTVLVIALLLTAFVGSFFLPLICDRHKISDRVALWDRGGRKYSGKMKILIAVVIIALVLPAVLGITFTVTATTREVRYSRTMSVLLTDSDSVAVEGNQAVTCEYQRISRLYIPEDRQAEAPEEVRYILRCTDGEEMTGFYGMNGVNGYQLWRTVEIVDRESDRVLFSETFYGSSPPNVISDDTTRDQYGFAPSEEEISAWVAQVLSGL